MIFQWSGMLRFCTLPLYLILNNDRTIISGRFGLDSRMFLIYLFFSQQSFFYIFAHRTVVVYVSFGHKLPVRPKLKQKTWVYCAFFSKSLSLLRDGTFSFILSCYLTIMSFSHIQVMTSDSPQKDTRKEYSMIFLQPNFSSN